MADKKDLIDISAFDEEPTQQDIEQAIDLSAYEQTPAQEISGDITPIEAAIQGAAAGSSFGLSDLTSAAAGTLGSYLGEDAQTREKLRQLEEQGFTGVNAPKEGIEGLLDTFRQARETASQRREKAFREQPGSALGGSIAGGFLGTGGAGLAAKGLSKLGTAGKALSTVLPSAEGITGISPGSRILRTGLEGAKAGALTGIGQEGEKLVTDTKEALTGVGEQALGGAVVGTALSGVTELAKGATKLAKESEGIQQLAKAFKKGAQGINTRTQQAVEKELNRARSVASDIRDNIKNAQSEIGQQIGQITESEGRSLKLADAVERLSDNLKAVPNVGDALEDKQKILKQLGKLNKQIDINNLSAKEADEISGTIKRLATDFEGKSALKSDKVKAIARGFSKDVSGEIQQQIDNPELNRLKDLYSKYKKLGKGAGLTEGFDEAKVNKEIDRLTDKILRASEPGKARQAYFETQRLVDALDEVDPTLAQQLEPKIKDLQDTYEVVRRSTELPEFSEGLISGLVGRGRAIGLRTANVAGGIKKSVTDVGEKVYESASNFSKQAPVEVQALAQRFKRAGGTASSFVRPLVQAAGSTEQRRSAILFGLYQQPGFRKLLENVGKDTKDILIPGEGKEK